jgi:hypothetical protein
MALSKKPIVPSWHGIKHAVDGRPWVSATRIGYDDYRVGIGAHIRGGPIPSYSVARLHQALLLFKSDSVILQGHSIVFAPTHYGYSRCLRAINAFLPFGWSLTTVGETLSLKHRPTERVWPYRAYLMIDNAGNVRSAELVDIPIVEPLSSGRSKALIHYSWEFKHGSTAVWNREVNQHSSIDEAVETCGEMNSACTECMAHRLVRVETLPDGSTFVTPVLYTANSVPKQLRKVQGLRRSAVGA